MVLNPEQFKAARWYGTGQEGFHRMFPEGQPLAAVPWEQAGRRRDRHDYDDDLVARHLSKPPGRDDIHEVDPRVLHAVQPSLVRAALSHYMQNDYRHGGPTYADQHMVGNRHPVIYLREDLHGRDPQYIIRSGHHRAASALLQGRDLRARLIEGGWGPMRDQGPPDLTRRRPYLKDL